MKSLIRWKIPVIPRITLGLVGMLVNVLMAVSLVGLLPDPHAESLRNHKQFCETAAICFSLLAEKVDTKTMHKCLESLAKRCDDVQSLGVRRDDGNLVVDFGDHDAHWFAGGDQAANDSQIWVQFYSQGTSWGKFEAAFTPSKSTLWAAALQRPELMQGVLVCLLCLGVFYFYLRVVLRHLDPSKVVPNRVREALDTLAEGLLILDGNERVVLANRAFERATGTQSQQLLGSPVDRIAFVSRDEKAPNLAPWREALQDGKAIYGRLLGIEGDANRTFSVSASPIIDEEGKSRGILASFEDVTRLEEKKRELTCMVDNLRSSSDVINQQNRELERLVSRDPLTDCLNRRSFFDRFEAIWKTAVRHDHSLCAVMVDIDFFKSINDNQGHSMGDEVLRQVASTLRNIGRESDAVCRYGGEEFALLLPMTAIDDAAITAERIRAAIAQLKFPTFTITASIGIAALSSETNQPHELLDRADKCLYIAKRSGRNRVVRWDEVSSSLVIDERSQCMSFPSFPSPVPSLSIPFVSS